MNPIYGVVDTSELVLEELRSFQRQVLNFVHLHERNGIEEWLGDENKLDFIITAISNPDMHEEALLFCTTYFTFYFEKSGKSLDDSEWSSLIDTLIESVCIQSDREAIPARYVNQMSKFISDSIVSQWDTRTTAVHVFNNVISMFNEGPAKVFASLNISQRILEDLRRYNNPELIKSYPLIIQQLSELIHFCDDLTGDKLVPQGIADMTIMGCLVFCTSLISESRMKFTTDYEIQHFTFELTKELTFFFSGGVLLTFLFFILERGNRSHQQQICKLLTLMCHIKLQNKHFLVHFIIDNLSSVAQIAENNRDPELLLVILQLLIHLKIRSLPSKSNAFIELMPTFIDNIMNTKSIKENYKVSLCYLRLWTLVIKDTPRNLTVEKVLGDVSKKFVECFFGAMVLSNEAITTLSLNALDGFFRSIQPLVLRSWRSFMNAWTDVITHLISNIKSERIAKSTVSDANGLQVQFIVHMIVETTAYLDAGAFPVNRRSELGTLYANLLELMQEIQMTVKLNLVRSSYRFYIEILMYFIQKIFTNSILFNFSSENDDFFNSIPNVKYENRCSFLFDFMVNCVVSVLNNQESTDKDISLCLHILREYAKVENRYSYMFLKRPGLQVLAKNLHRGVLLEIKDPKRRHDAHKTLFILCSHPISCEISRILFEKYELIFCSLKNLLDQEVADLIGDFTGYVRGCRTNEDYQYVLKAMNDSFLSEITEMLGAFYENFDFLYSALSLWEAILKKFTRRTETPMHSGSWLRLVERFQMFIAQLQKQLSNKDPEHFGDKWHSIIIQLLRAVNICLQRDESLADIFKRAYGEDFIDVILDTATKFMETVELNDIPCDEELSTCVLEFVDVVGRKYLEEFVGDDDGNFKILFKILKRDYVPTSLSAAAKALCYILQSPHIEVIKEKQLRRIVHRFWGYFYDRSIERHLSIEVLRLTVLVFKDSIGEIETVLEKTILPAKKKQFKDQFDKFASNTQLLKSANTFMGGITRFLKEIAPMMTLQFNV